MSVSVVEVPEPEARLLYCAEEAAHLLSVSRTQVYELMAAGVLTSVKVGRLRRIRHSDLVTYIESLES